MNSKLIVLTSAMLAVMLSMQACSSGSSDNNDSGSGSSDAAQQFADQEPQQCTDLANNANNDNETQWQGAVNHTVDFVVKYFDQLTVRDLQTTKLNNSLNDCDNKLQNINATRRPRVYGYFARGLLLAWGFDQDQLDQIPLNVSDNAGVHGVTNFTLPKIPQNPGNETDQAKSQNATQECNLLIVGIKSADPVTMQGAVNRTYWWFTNQTNISQSAAVNQPINVCVARIYNEVPIGRIMRALAYLMHKLLANLPTVFPTLPPSTTTPSGSTTSGSTTQSVIGSTTTAAPSSETSTSAEPTTATTTSEATTTTTTTPITTSV